VGGWLVYDALCRTALKSNGALLGGVLAVLLGAAAFALCELFSGRGAFIEFGAMLGTIMVANVFFVIIPAQREMVRAKEQGREPDPNAGLRGRLRSVHNTYFTLPVLFTMISNHYALTFGARYNWLVLIALSAAGALIRVYFVQRHKRRERGGATSPWPAVAALSILAATAWTLVPRSIRPASAGAAASAAAGSDSDLVRFAGIEPIVAARCAPCHAAAPTQPGFATAPKGLLLDSPDAIISHAALIAPQVASRAMPIGNLTGMTDPEREKLLDWIQRGAPR
jgi:uncharacterized membrane protein